jgi:tRNA threonylcarbamoyl adenosine modification protein (Sua5/YciO/YrdC/YwlC family)
VIDDAAIEAAAVAARSGRLIVFPTDTVYGVGTRPDDPRATAAVFEAKGRPQDLTLPVLVASEGEARRAAVFDKRAGRLAAAYWPGALTIVLPRTELARGWRLGGDGASIGVRVPGDERALRLLGRTGPLAATSANRSGEPPAEDGDALVAIFGDRVAVYLVADSGLHGAASTVVDLTGPRATILRNGDLDPGAVLALAG